MKHKFATAALIALLSLAGGAQSADLPDLGSSADAVLSPHQATLVGANMLHRMRALNQVVDDPQLHAYINDLGYRLLAHTDFPDDMRFTFFVVRDTHINAFAAPGGYIGINSGLITATRNEDELAGVMAHEIAHITQHHLQRSLADAQKMAPLAGLAMLGAVLASQASQSGDAAPAIMIGGMGALQQRRINFTRKDEAEADRIGIETLARAGFDVDGMANFFSRMLQLLRPSISGNHVPELLQSHPVTSRRISEANARAEALKQKYADQGKPSPGAGVQWGDTVAPVPYVKAGEALFTHGEADQATDALNYRLMRARARVLTAPSRKKLVKYYAGKIASSKKSADPTALQYGYALALVRNNEAKKGLAELQPLVEKHADNTALELALANAELHAGQRDKSLAAYAKLKQHMPTNHAVIDAYADALLTSGTSKDAAKAAALLRPLLDENVNEPTLYRTYGRACALSGQDIRAGEAYADATYLSGRATDALEQLQRLLKRKDLNYYQRARIQARIDFITPIVMELNRRGITPAEQGIG